MTDKLDLPPPADCPERNAKALFAVAFLLLELPVAGELLVVALLPGHFNDDDVSFGAKLLDLASQFGVLDPGREDRPG